MASRSVLVLQHVRWERPALIGDVLTSSGIEWALRSIVDASDTAEIPSLDELGGIVILGGPMGALDFEAFPGLGLEAELVRLAVDNDVPLFGVCLGHQIIATALGARLHSGAASEVGIGEVTATADDGVFGSTGDIQPVLHWHHDVVEVPDGAKILASTDQTPNQAFRLGNAVFATQFHLEVDRPMLESWLAVPDMVADLDARNRASLESDYDHVAGRMRELGTRAATDFAAAVNARG